jgi:hypothetical protein
MEKKKCCRTLEYAKLIRLFFFIFLSVLGIATRYGMDGLGIKSRWGARVLHPPRLTLGLTQPPTQWVTCLFP